MTDEPSQAPGGDLDAVLLGYLTEAEAGREPDREQFLARHPDLARELRAFFDVQDFIRSWIPSPSADATPATVGETPTGAYHGPAEELPPEFPGFEVLGRIGQGGMGSVYQARDTQLPREVAVKVMRLELAGRPEYRARFLREAEALAALNHDHVVRVLLVGEAAGRPYFVMPLLRGEPLSARLDRVGPLPPAELGRLGRELALGLAAIHHAGQIHRDLKPSNVWLEEPQVGAEPGPGGWGRALILDFGLAKVEGSGASEATAAGVILGTPAYMAPEQASGGEVTPQADLFALGCLLYHAATGTPPFGKGDPVAILSRMAGGMPAAPAERNLEVPEGLSALILDLLAKDPGDRPGPPERVADDIRRLSSPGAPAERPRPREVSAPRPRKSRLAWLALGALPVLVLLALAGWRLWPDRPTGPTSEDPPTRPVLPPPAGKPLAIRPLEVWHFENLGNGEGVNRGRIGNQSQAARWNDAVRIQVRLSEPGYFYLVGYNFDGHEQLLWPAADTPPDERQELMFPGGDDQLYLDDKAPGGIQVYVVAASREPLPAWQEWRRGVQPPWQQHPPLPGVWASDGRDTFVVDLSRGINRGQVKKGLSTPPLTALCRAMRTGKVEAVEAVAFPVLPRKKD